MRIVARLMLILVVVLAACGDNERAHVAPDDGGAPDISVADTGRVPIDAAIGPDTPTLACTVQELQPLFTCVTSNCLDFSFDGGLPQGGDGGLGFDPTQLLTCVATRCGLLVFGLPPSCRSCVLSGLSGLASGNFDGALAACVN